LAAIAFNRMELTISRDEKWQAARDAETIAALMHQVNNIMLGGCQGFFYEGSVFLLSCVVLFYLSQHKTF